MHEVGGHRIQRVPPTERRGRVHTSTVTVSVTDSSLKNNNKFILQDDEHFKIEWFSGTGKGGQHRNKHANSARITHLPTGLKQEKQGRKREANKTEAMKLLLQKLNEKNHQYGHANLSKIKKEQKGSGMRGDKIRTYRFQDGLVYDHQTNKKAKVNKVMKGSFDLLWN